MARKMLSCRRDLQLAISGQPVYNAAVPASREVPGTGDFRS